MALIRKVVEIETNENSTRFGSGFYIECQLLGKVSKSELVDLKLFRIPGDESGTTIIVRYVHEDICVRTEDMENNKLNRYTYVKNGYDSVNKGYLIDIASLLYIQTSEKIFMTMRE